MWNNTFVGALALCGFLLNCWPQQADAIDETYLYNPKPAADDFVLPMPGDLKMVFRPVEVPGTGFWGVPDRFVDLGDGEGKAIFETRTKVEVGGSFRAPSGEGWLIYLGKHEVTRAQYAAVMGGGDIEAGLKALFERSFEYQLPAGTSQRDARIRNENQQRRQKLMNARGDARLRILALPLTGLSYYDYLDFIDRYARWCFDTSSCLEKLPRFDPCPGGIRTPAYRECRKNIPPESLVPGFFRLPTETEWEYAARGNPLSSSDFERTLPFERTAARQYAWIGKSQPTRIGRQKPTHGFYDLFGNVAELTSGLFHTRMGAGKPGALTVRGGSFQTTERDLRSSLRSEVGIYEWVPDRKKMKTVQTLSMGIRLAIGSYTIVDPSFYERIAQSYEAYRSMTVATVASLAAGTRSPGVGGPTPHAMGAIYQTSESLERIKEIAGDLKRSHPREASLLSTSVQQAQQDLYKQMQSASYQAADNLFLAALSFARDFGDEKRARKALASAVKVARVNIRMQPAIGKIKTRIERAKANANTSFKAYVAQMKNLSENPGNLAREGLARVKTRINRTPGSNRLGLKVFTIMQQHTEEALQGRRATSDWRRQMEQEFSDLSLFQRQ